MRFDLNQNVFDDATATALTELKVPFEDTKLSKVLCQILISTEERAAVDVKTKRFSVLAKLFAAMGGDGFVELTADEVGVLNGAVDTHCATLMLGLIKRILSNPVQKPEAK